MNLIDYLKIESTCVSKERVELLLPISEIHHQPFGYLHGAINGVLIETACSIGANEHLISPQYAVGLDLHVNHLNKAQKGQLRVVAKPIKIGLTIQFWTAEVYLEGEYIVANGSCTLTVRG
ncbi:MAG: PaaI family thioesterase [Enterococcus lacertideformus]|uniref:PaaI family thioesterase n=1 Tax=Enterococcus lacertideformus TaxID=2771493 RepID=A0A931AUI4_9ENTE|nr:PaaI family thioesterase [Enterococcus lacertideformus]